MAEQTTAQTTEAVATQEPVVTTPAVETPTTFEPSPQEVFSAANISQAISAPITKPDLTDPLGIRVDLETQLGLPGLQATEQDVLSRLQKARATERTQQTALENLPQALNLIRGEQAEARRLSSAEIQTLVDEQAVAQTARLAAEQRADTLFNIVNQERTRTLDLAFEYPGANVKLTDTPEQIQDKLRDFQLKEEERVKKDSEKAALKEMYFQLTGKVAKPMSRGALRKKINKAGGKQKDIERKQREFEDKMQSLQLKKLEAQIAELGAATEVFNPGDFF